MSHLVLQGAHYMQTPHHLQSSHPILMRMQETHNFRHTAPSFALYCLLILVKQRKGEIIGNAGAKHQQTAHFLLLSLTVCA